MSSRMKFLSALLLAIVFSGAAGLAAPDNGAEKAFTGDFNFGYRSVMTGGSADKYREQVNLDRGVRLFNFNLSYVASGDLKTIFDRIDLTANNLGGDPYESLGVSIQKYGTYKFQYNHRKSTYFYGDLNEVSPGRLFDSNRSNFDRVSDSGSLSLTLHPNVGVFANFNRYTRSGDSAVTYSLDEREILTDQAVSEKMTEIAAGVDLHTKRYGLVFEQKFQDFKNAGWLLTATPFDFTSNASTFRLNARPLDGLLLRGSAQLSTLDATVRSGLDAGAQENLSGLLTADSASEGTFTRKFQLYDFDLTYLLFNRVAVIGAVRYNRFTQAGSLAVEGIEEAADLGFHTLSVEGGLQLEVGGGFSLTGGYRYEKRTLNGAGEGAESGSAEAETSETSLQSVTGADSTVRNGLFGNLRWYFKNLKMTADYQHGAYTDPFTLISPTTYDRFRATFRYPFKAFTLTATYLMTRTQNLIEGGVNFRTVYSADTLDDLWKASYDQFNIRLNYHTAVLEAYVGYSYIDFKSDSTRYVAYNPYWTGPGGEFSWPIHYEGKSTLLDASFAVAIAKDWKVGVFANSYSSYKNSGFWPIERMMFRGYIEYSFLGGFIGQLGYRYYDFKEKDTVLIIRNNYHAGIFEVSFGYRWQ